jgi:hypothetical protein
MRAKSLLEFLNETGEALTTDPGQPLKPEAQAENLDPYMAAYLTKNHLAIACYDAVRLLHAVTREKYSVVTAQQIRAAIAILDRAGFGPTSTVNVRDPEDLTKLDENQLLQRIDSLRQYLVTKKRSDEEDPSVH